MREASLMVGMFNRFRPGRVGFESTLTNMLYALIIEKQQKPTALHRVPRCELVDLLFL